MHPAPPDTPVDLLSVPRRVAECVVELYSSGPVAVAQPRQIRKQVSDMLAALEETVAGRPAHGIRPGPLDRMELLHALRTETLRDWSDDDEGLLTLMHAMESIRENLPEDRRNVAMGAALTPFSRELLREVSHLLRSPLGSIVMLADMLRDEKLGPLTAAQARQVSIIYRAALGITSTANDILTLVDVREHIRRTEGFSLVEVLNTVCDVLGPVSESKGQSIGFRVDADPLRHGPALALREILLSLGLRAALEAGSGELGLSAVDEEDDTVRFAVEARPRPASDDAVGDRVPEGLMEILRVDDESGGFTISPGALGVAAVSRMLDMLDSSLERSGAGEPGSSNVFFRLKLPRA